MAGLSVVTKSGLQPVDFLEVKDYLKLDDNTDERTLRILVAAARDLAESYMGRSLTSQTLKLSLDGFNEMSDPLWEGLRQGPDLAFYKRFVKLPRSPVASVTTVITYDDSDTATTMASSKYYVDTVGEPGRVVLRNGESWPTALRVANAVEGTYVAGYTNPSSIPEAIKEGLLAHVAFMFENRGDEAADVIDSMPVNVKRAYAPYVIYEGMGSSMLLAV